MINQEHSGMLSDGSSNPFTDWDHSTAEPNSLSRTKAAHLRIERILTEYNIEPEELLAELMLWSDEEDVYVDELIDAAKSLYLTAIDNEDSEVV